jgi:hypothetical protein
MNALARQISRLYVLLLRLYPPGFRAGFAGEASWVFDLRVKDAAGKGLRDVLRITLLELSDLPSTLFALYARERRHPVMKRLPSQEYHPRLGLGAALLCIGGFLLVPWCYAAITLQVARADGVYASPEAGMLGLIAKTYIEPERTQILYEGTNSFDGSDPHVRYVIACVWGGRRSDGTPVGSEKKAFDQPGMFFLNVRDGWVFVPEGAFPELLGKVMKVYGMAGPGTPAADNSWGGASPGDCTF